MNETDEAAPKREIAVRATIGVVVALAYLLAILIAGEKSLRQLAPAAIAVIFAGAVALAIAQLSAGRRTVVSRLVFATWLFLTLLLIWAISWPESFARLIFWR